MATEEWKVDGVNLSSLAHDITSRDGMDSVPAVSGSNVKFAQRHGERWVPKYFTAARKTLVMWVSAADPVTGARPTSLDDRRANLDANIDSLTRLFGRRRRLLDVRRDLSNGTTRQADCEVVAQIDPMMVGLADAKFSVELTVPSGFWRDVSSSTLADVAPGSALLLPGLASATAPMDDLEYRIVGPATNPRVTDVESGSYFQYNGTVNSGTTLVVRNKTMDVQNGTLGNMVHVGEPNWVTLYPTLNGVTINFTASGTSGTTRLQIVGRKAFLR